jgi:hypothetical protein
MIPNTPDCDYKNGEPPLTKKQINQFAKTYKKYQFIDHEHGLTRNGKRIGEPKNSFLLTEDTTLTTQDGSHTYPEGTWMVTSHITDETAIQNALSGGYTGYSASVFTQSRADEYLAALKSNPDTELPCSCKDINSTGNSLIKDVPHPVVLSVSLVKSPCLHDSKFCELDGDIMTDEVSMKSKILEAIGMSEQAEVEALKSQVVSLESKIDEMQANFNEALKSMQEAFESSLKEALTPVAEKAEEEDVEVEEVEAEPEVEETTETVEEATEEETVEEEPEEETETEPVAEKGHSKSEPVHDNVQAEKSEPFNVYTAMGRNLDGTAKRH